MRKREKNDKARKDSKKKKMRNGYLELKMGPMFAGKTTYLLTELTQYADLGMKVMYINHIADNRTVESGDGIVSTHNSQFSCLSKKIEGVKLERLSQVNVDDYEIIGVDEGQFFNDLTENVLKWVQEKQKIVIVCCLDADCQQKFFGQGYQLIPHADKYEKLTALCLLCRQQFQTFVPAPFTSKRIYSPIQNQVDIGGTDKYVAVCRHHYSQLNPNP